MIAAPATQRPSVLFVSALDLWSLGQQTGGPALSRTVTAYREAGWRVVFITSNVSDHEQSIPGIEVLRFDFPGIRRLFGYRRLGFLARALFWCRFQLRAIALARRAFRGHPPCSLVYGYEITGIPAARLLAWLWRRPYVSRFQGTTYRVHWQRKALSFLRAWDHCLALHLPADMIIMTDDGTIGDRVLEEAGADMTKVRFWRNGVDKERFRTPLSRPAARERLGLGQGFLLLTVSRLVRWKRVDRAIAALADVLRTTGDVRLIVVGEGEERDALLALADRLGVADRVAFVGAVPHDVVPDYLAACDVFLSLYDWSNVGNPLLEAMLAGACIVTLDNGGTSRLIRNEENGLLLDEDDAQGLSRSILRLLSDSGLRDALGAGAKTSARQFWTWKQRLAAELTDSRRLVESWPQ